MGAFTVRGGVHMGGDPLRERAVQAVRQGLEAAVGAQALEVGVAAREAGLLAFARAALVAFVGFRRLARPTFAEEGERGFCGHR